MRALWFYCDVNGLIISFSLFIHLKIVASDTRYLEISSKVELFNVITPRDGIPLIRYAFKILLACLVSLCVCQLLVLLYCLNRFSSSSISEDAPLQEDSLPAFCGFAWFPPQAELQRRKGEMWPVAHNYLTTKGTHCRLQIICIAATSHTSETRAMRHNKRVKQSDES